LKELNIDPGISMRIINRLGSATPRLYTSVKMLQCRNGSYIPNELVQLSLLQTPRKKK